MVHSGAVWGVAVERGCYKLLLRLVRWPIQTVSHCLANVVPSSGLTVLVCSSFCWLLNVICCLTWVFSLTECSATGGKSEVWKLQKRGNWKSDVNLYLQLSSILLKLTNIPVMKTSGIGLFEKMQATLRVPKGTILLWAWENASRLCGRKNFWFWLVIRLMCFKALGTFDCNE